MFLPTELYYEKMGTDLQHCATILFLEDKSLTGGVLDCEPLVDAMYEPVKRVGGISLSLVCPWEVRLK
jgi:hypothetical protein